MLFADLQCWFTVKPEKKERKEQIFMSQIMDFHYTSSIYIILHQNNSPTSLTCKKNIYVHDIVTIYLTNNLHL